MAKSVKENFIFNLINTLSGLLFPLITFPYASRIMLADGVGQVQFYISIISYVTLLSSIGIPLYAIREIACVRKDVKQMNIAVIEILLLHVFLTSFGYLIIGVLCLTIDEIQINLPLFLVLSTSVFFTTIGCEWFYQGIEDFKYIAIRSLLIKIIYVVLLFFLVKDKEDLLIYGILTVFGTVGNNLFNFARLRKYVSLSEFKFKELHPFKHLLPTLKIFVLNLIISFYINLNPVMLGFMVDVTAVGYFTAASKISHMLLGVSGALQNAVLPRASNLLQMGDYEKFKQLTQKVMDFIIMLTLPLTIGLIILAPSIISVFCGESYRPAAFSLAILAPIIFVISLSGLFGIQMLYPQGKERLVIISTCAGATVNIILNLILIPYIGFDGASIATLAAEVTVTGVMSYIGRKYLPISMFNRHYLNCITGSLIMGIACAVVYYLLSSDIECLFCVTIVAFLVYTSWMLYRKDEMTISMLEMIEKRVTKRR